MRKGEILSLRWADVDLKNRKVTVKKTKNNEIRVIPINQTLYQELAKIEKQSDNGAYVFTSKDGEPFGDIKKGFLSALKLARIARISAFAISGIPLLAFGHAGD